MGNFLFFAAMSLATLGVKYRSDRRDVYLHHGNWLLKLCLWLGFTALPFLLPNAPVAAYSWLARLGSGAFLVIQLVILLDFVQSLNESWVAWGEEDGGWLWGLLGVTLALYAGAATLGGLMFWWFKPPGAGACSFNVAFITLALLLCAVFTVVALHPRIQSGSVFPAACVSLYCMYLCLGALQSEPPAYACNGLAHARASAASASGGSFAVGMVFTMASVVYAAFRAGSNTNLFSLDDDGDEERGDRAALLLDGGAGGGGGGDMTRGLTSAGLDGEGDALDPAVARLRERKARAIDDFTPVTYNYSFFHLIFALASMYIAMLMTGWGGAADQEAGRLDVGWGSVAVKLAAMFLTACLYIWVMLAPVVFPDRSFG